jgi:hypothetical protein
MTHSINFDKTDTQTRDQSLSKFMLDPPENIDTEELSELRARLEEKGLVDEAVESSDRDTSETLTIRELFETPVAFESEQKSLQAILSTPIPLADGSSLPLTDLYWLVEADDWDVDEVRRITLDEVLDTPFKDIDGLTLRELYDQSVTMDTDGRQAFLGEQGQDPFTGVSEQWDATFEYKGETYSLEAVAFSLLEFDEDRSSTPYELYGHVPLGLARTENSEGYRTVSPDELDEAYPLRLIDLLDDHYGIHQPVALGVGDMAMAGPLINVAASLIPTIVLSANFIRNHWDEIRALVETISDFYAERNKAIETTVAVDCPDGSRVSIDYTGDADEFQTILSELEVACE